ncbi:IS200/IS605 family element transposase accessory protein TnpB [Deinococcus sp. D7000]|nr:IS200/IS605 family element transposase accessory protein TnpB [Deinococcus sp. D7000]
MQQNTTVRVFRYRLYPTKPQEAAMFETLRLTRTLYNAGLEQRREAYRKHGKTLSAYDQQRELTALKEACPEYGDVYSHVLQDVFDRLDRAYKAFFSRVKKGAKRAGFPRFKPRQRWDSFKFKQCWNNKKGDWTACGKPVDEGRRINIPKIGAVKIKLHRPLEGKPKSLQIVLDVDQWYAVYTCEVPLSPLPATCCSVGIDLGTTWFAVTSDGEFIKNPRHLGRSLKKLRVQQRTVARRKKGGKRRRKAVQMVARTHRKVRRQRLDFQHKTARKLVDEHDVIAHENLQVGSMAQSNLARSILDAGWAGFLFQLSSKAESAGRRVIAVDPRYTSQRCNACGHTGKENRVNQANFRCVQCGHRANADHNAAKNILGRAVPSALNGSGVSHAVV